MTTIHWGVEELIARQQIESTERSVRHAWHLTEFRRTSRHQPVTETRKQYAERVNELVVLATTQARWAMI